MKNLKSLLITTLMISTFLIACDEESDDIKITSIGFNSATVEVVEGTTVNLEDLITVEGEDADQAAFELSSADEDIVSIDGLILSAVAVGETTVEATETNINQTATVTITVIANTVAVTEVSLDKAEANVKVGESFQLTATITPENATEKGLTWSVAFPPESKTLEDDPTAIATVSDAGLVTAISAGDVVITATTTDGEFTASTEVSITNVAVTSVDISPDPVEVDVNGSTQLTVTIAPENATIKTVVWSVKMIEEQASRTSAAAPTVDDYLEISEEGLLTAKQRCDDCLFTATATADGDITATVNVTINYIAVTSITLDPSSFFKVGVGETKQMEYIYTPENASDPTITWDLELINACKVAAVAPSIDDYATIDENGKITGVATTVCGATVSASHPDLSGPEEIDFSVVQYVTSLTILNQAGGEAGSAIDMNPCSTSYDLGVTVNPGNATNSSVTWSIEEQDYFQIDQSGNISPKTTIPGILTISFEVMIVADDGSGIAKTVQINFDNSGCE